MASKYPTILQIAPTPFFSERGYHVRIDGVVRCLTALSYDNTICTYADGKDIDDLDIRRITPLKNANKLVPRSGKYKLRADWRLLWLAVKTYREIKPVAIHAHLHEGIAIGWCVKLLFFWRRTPLIGDLQYSLSSQLEKQESFKKQSLLYRFVKPFERLLLWSTTYIVCSSEYLLEVIQDRFGIDSRKVMLAQDGTDPVPPLSHKRAQLIRKKLRIPENKTVIVYSGSLKKSKSLGDLKQLIVNCKPLEDELHFLILGHPKDELSSFLRKMKVRKMCTLTGKIDFKKLPQYLGVADIAIDPKYLAADESVTQLLIYMSNNLPVVAFNGENNRKFLPLGTPLANSPSELLDNLKNLHNDPELRAEAASAHLQQFQDHYSWKVTQQQLAAVYAQALE